MNELNQLSCNLTSKTQYSQQSLFIFQPNLNFRGCKQIRKTILNEDDLDGKNMGHINPKKGLRIIKVYYK